MALLLALLALTLTTSATTPHLVACDGPCEGTSPSTPVWTALGCASACSVVISSDDGYFWAGCGTAGSFTATWRPSGYIGGLGCEYWAGGAWPYYWQTTDYVTTGGTLTYVGA